MKGATSLELHLFFISRLVILLSKESDKEKHFDRKRASSERMARTLEIYWLDGPKPKPKMFIDVGSD